MSDVRDHVDPGEISRQLNAAANALDKASNRLVDLVREFEGGVDERGEYQPGPQLLWMEAVGDELDDIVKEYEGTRAPLKDVLEHRAAKRAKQKHPDLWADYHRLRSEVSALQKWISSKKETISARQSVLKAESALSYSPGYQAPAWSGGGS